MGLFNDGNSAKVRNYRPSCGVTCSQYKYCNSPKLQYLAKKQGGILFVGAEPTATQDKKGDVFTGSFKKYISPLLSNFDKDLISYTFVAPCKGVYIDEMQGEKYEIQIESCAAFLKSTIEKTDPKVIVPLDEISWDALTMGANNGRLDGMKYNDHIIWHCIPNQTLKRFIAPIFSPKSIAVLHNNDFTIEKGDFYEKYNAKFLKDILSKFSKLKWFNYSKMIEDVVIVDSFDVANKILRSIIEDEPEILAFDYETDSLKMERFESNIYLLGIAYDDKVYAMEFYNNNEEFLDLYKQIMLNPKIGKVAHNAKFEARATKSCLGYFPVNWINDTMLAARILNSRDKAGLKPQVLYNFGITGYDSVEQYLTSTKESKDIYGSNTINTLRSTCERIKSIKKKALMYVGQDALYTLELHFIQEKLLENDKHLAKGVKLFNSSINALAAAECNGLVIDMDNLDSTIKDCQERLSDIETSIAKDITVTKFWPKDKVFDYNKNDLNILLYDLMGLKCPKKTKSGSNSTDSEVLEKLDIPICDKILKARALSKMLSTYLNNLKSEAVFNKEKNDYTMHTFFNLNVAATYRSSSSQPNIQNYPIRTPEGSKVIRSCIVPHKGCKLVGYDYKAMEVSAGCSIHGDKNMTSFLYNDGDMHQASAKGCLIFTDAEWNNLDKVIKKIARGAAKTFNFASFYGSYYAQTAPTLWDVIAKHDILLQHLKTKNVRSYNDFFDHMREMDKNLWEVQFPEYGEWRKDIYKFYLKHGYVDLVTGFRCHGPLSRNESTNSPIQGPAFHCLLWAFTKVTQELKRKGLRSFIVGQIHDCLILCVYPDEEEIVDIIVRKWGVDEIRNEKDFSWLKTPLAMEKEFSLVREDGGNWHEMEEGGYI